MEINPKLPQYFEKLKSDFQELSMNPSKEQLEKVKGDLEQFINEINNLNI